MVEIEEEEPHEPNTTSTSIQLGFSEPISSENEGIIGHRSPYWWKDWDGGQMGGKPSWLNPQRIPRRPLYCPTCAENNKETATPHQTIPMIFLCQLYAPLDNIPSAFHRSLYVFGCPRCCGQQKEGGIRVLRVQLPQNNPYYPLEDAEEKDDWTKHLPNYYNLHLCQVCGQIAAGKCPLQQLWFCSPGHQKEYKKWSLKKNNDNTQEGVTADNKDIPEGLLQETNQGELNNSQNQQNITNPPKYLPSVYAESELVVEEEPPAKNDEKEDSDNDDDEEIEQRPTMFASSKAIAADQERDSDEDLEQDDLNEMITGQKIASKKEDPTTDAFYHRISNRPNYAKEQCLRYNMQWRHSYDKQGSDPTKNNAPDSTTNAKDQPDNTPLWIRSDHQPSDNKDIPPCPYCHAPRAFEFQLMPQMLSFLHSNRPKKATSKNNETAKQALLAAQQIIESSDPSQIPPSFVEAKEKALKALQHDLNNGDDNDGQQMDWGVIAIYTCTQSCSSSTSSTTDDDALLGAYREDFAWVQPPLDM